MKLIIPLLAVTLLPLSAHADTSQVPNAAGTITVDRAENGCEITLPPDKAKTLTDQLFLVIDGKSEGFGGDFYLSEMASKPVHYTASVGNDLDDQVKDILKAQGVPVKLNVTTYRIACGVNVPNNISMSRSLTFRHASNVLAYTHYPAHAIYKIGDKIPLFEAVALDSGISPSGTLFQSAEKQDQVPHDLLHRITIQVQFVPKATR